MENLLIIQARMGSSRLPGKVLKKFGNKDVLTYVVDRCLKISNVDKIIVATSNLEKDNAIQKWCETEEIECFRGSEKNVLSRYIDICEKYKPKHVIRVTADCPFLDYKMANEMLTLIKHSEVDIIDFDEDLLPRGVGVEVFSYAALKYINEKATKDYQYEHVTYYAYEYKNEFKRVNYNIPLILKKPNLRLTLDTEEDYKMLNIIANSFVQTTIETSKVITFLNKNSSVANINSGVKQKQVK